MKTLFVAAGPYSWGSSRMRCYWPAKVMGAEVMEWSAWDRTFKPDGYDTYIFQKSIDPADANKLVSLGKRVFWDVCDPAWWWSPNECREIADAVTGVVASSEALADDFNDWYRAEKAVCIPDRLDMSHFSIKRQHADVSPVRFIWYGVAVNRVAIMGQLANLERLAANGYKVELTIMDDRPDARFIGSDTLPVYHVQWNVERENEIIAAHDIALLPPYPGPWGGVKSNNKHLTAWACGLPVVDRARYSYLEDLVGDFSGRADRGADGYQQVVDKYTADKSAADWEALLCK